LADPVSCEPIDSFDPAESTSTSDNDEDETAIFEPHQSEDEEARILSLIEQCLNTKGKADFDVDLDNELEQAVLPLINEFASRKKIPLRILSNADDKRAVLADLHKFHAHSQAMRAAMLSRGITWKKAWSDCVEFALRCEACRAFNSQKITHASLSSLTSAQPFSILNIDIMGPIDWVRVNDKYSPTLPESSSSKAKDAKRFFVLLCVCVCTGYLVMRSIVDKSAKTINAALSSIFSEYGNPRLICSDQEASFKSDAVQSFVRSEHIQWRFSTTYSPRSNGVVERRVGIVKAIMERLIYDKVFKFDNWADSIRSIQLHINSRLDRDSGYSPFMLMFGRFPNGSSGLANTAKLNTDFDFTEWCKQQNLVTLQVIPSHCASKLKRKMKSLNYYDSSRNVVNEPLELGQPVYLRNIARKFGDPNWAGPYFVCAVRNNSRGIPSHYKLREVGGTAASIVPDWYPRDQLKVIANDTFAHEIDNDTVIVESIYHAYKHGGSSYFLVKHLGSDTITWMHESQVGDALKYEYLEARKKFRAEKVRQRKSPNQPFSWKFAINLAAKPFLNGGSYQYHEDENNTTTNKASVLNPSELPLEALALMDFKKANKVISKPDQLPGSSTVA
jgi:transposase InsO family protein